MNLVFRQLVRVLSVTFCVTFLLLTLPTKAIIVRHDISSSAYKVLPAKYPQVFYLHERYGNKICVATLIARQWAITAAHCTVETPLGAVVGSGEKYPVVMTRNNNVIDRIVIHPSFNTETSRTAVGVDLALLHLSEEQLMDGVSLYNDNQEFGLPAMMLGWGFTGTGLRGRSNTNDGDFRQSWNVVDVASQRLEFKFDDPRDFASKVHPLEGIPSMGDSGGPALIELNNKLVLIGVARGEITGEDVSSQGKYGSQVIYERVSLHIEWINGVISEP